MPSPSHLVLRDEAVLIVVDVQEKLAAAMERRTGVVDALVRMVRLAAVAGLPIVVTRQYPDGLGDTVAELAEALLDAATATTVTTADKVAFCACEEPAFLDALEATGRTQAVIAGMESHICVAQTALSLVGAGFAVQVVADASCSRRASDHDVAMDRLRAAGVTVTTSESVMYEVVSRAGTDEFRNLLAIVKGT